MDLINEAAAGGSEATPIVIVPGPAGETPVGAREAARSLASWRQKRDKQQPDQQAGEQRQAGANAQASTPEHQTSDEAGPGEGDPRIHGDKPPAGETESGDPDAGSSAEAPANAELAPIEPPKSWTKADKDLFASLPRETQERIAERERSREGDLGRRQQEAAEQRKALEADRAGMEQARQRYESALPHLLDAVLKQQGDEFADIKTLADAERLAREDQPRYLRWDLQLKKINAMVGELAQAHARQDAERLQEFTAFARRQDELIQEKVPELADAAQVARLQSGAVAVLRDHGFDDAELAASWQGRKDFSLRDHRVQLVIRDATLWREARQKAKAAVAKPLPPVQRPGVSQGRGAAQDAIIQNLNKQLENASGVNALRTAAKLVAAKRAGR
jgi:hypothetical protein